MVRLPARPKPPYLHRSEVRPSYWHLLITLIDGRIFPTCLKRAIILNALDSHITTIPSEISLERARLSRAVQENYGIPSWGFLFETAFVTARTGTLARSNPTAIVVGSHPPGLLNLSNDCCDLRNEKKKTHLRGLGLRKKTLSVDRQKNANQVRRKEPLAQIFIAKFVIYENVYSIRRRFCGRGKNDQSLLQTTDSIELSATKRQRVIVWDGEVKSNFQLSPLTSVPTQTHRNSGNSRFVN